MKKFILSLLTALFCLVSALSTQSAVPCTAQTEQSTDQQPTVGGYACILTHDVFFYADKQEKSGLFLLPESYYVKILDVAPDFCKIEYLYDDTAVKKLTGYAKTSQLTFVSYVPKRPYLYQIFDVHYTLSDAVNTSSVLNDLVISCAYYGDYTIGSQTYCYVLRGEQFGYVPKPADFTIERNGEYDEWLQSVSSAPEQDEPPAAQEETPSSSPAQIALLVAVCLLVPILAAFLFRSPKNQPYEDE